MSARERVSRYTSSMKSPTATSHGRRQKRLIRNENPDAFRITARDMDILRYLARFRFLSSAHIVRLVDGSEQQVLRRLRKLFDHGFCERPRSQIAQLANFHDEGNRPLVYGLATSGSRLLALDGYGAIDRLDWTTKSSRATNDFLVHTLETAEVMIGFEQACREEQAPRLIDHHALLPYLPEATRSDDDPFRLDVQVSMQKSREPIEIAVIPDRLFSLFLPNETRLNFALERDRGTMDIWANQLVGKSSYRRKLLGYWQGWQADRHTSRWGFKAFRMLTVTTTDGRVKNMLEAQRRIVGPQGSNMFLFTTLDRLIGRSPFDPVWISGKGETVTLLPPTTSALDIAS